MELCALIEALSVSLFLNNISQVFEHLQQRSQDGAQNDNGVSAALELSYSCLAVSLGIPTQASLMEIYKQIKRSCAISKQINFFQASYIILRIEL